MVSYRKKWRSTTGTLVSIAVFLRTRSQIQARCARLLLRDANWHQSCFAYVRACAKWRLPHIKSSYPSRFLLTILNCEDISDSVTNPYTLYSFGPSAFMYASLPISHLQHPMLISITWCDTITVTGTFAFHNVLVSWTQMIFTGLDSAYSPKFCITEAARVWEAVLKSERPLINNNPVNSLPIAHAQYTPMAYS